MSIIKFITEIVMFDLILLSDRFIEIVNPYMVCHQFHERFDNVQFTTFLKNQNQSFQWMTFDFFSDSKNGSIFSFNNRSIRNRSKMARHANKNCHQVILYKWPKLVTWINIRSLYFVPWQLTFIFKVLSCYHYYFYHKYSIHLKWIDGTQLLLSIGVRFNSLFKTYIYNNR